MKMTPAQKAKCKLFIKRAANLNSPEHQIHLKFRVAQSMQAIGVFLAALGRKPDPVYMSLTCHDKSFLK